MSIVRVRRVTSSTDQRGGLGEGATVATKTGKIKPLIFAMNVNVLHFMELHEILYRTVLLKIVTFQVSLKSVSSKAHFT
jgi:hypothetical protein